MLKLMKTVSIFSMVIRGFPETMIMTRLFLLVCLLLTLTGCASTLTSQNIRVIPQPAQKLEIGMETSGLDLQEAKALAPYRNNFYSVLVGESNGQVGTPGPGKLRMSASLRYTPKFSADDFIGITSFFIPFLAFVPDNGREDFYVDYLLRDERENIIYSKKLHGVAEGNSSGYYIARINAANNLKAMLAQYTAENAARLILNDLRGNTLAIHGRLRTSQDMASVPPSIGSSTAIVPSVVSAGKPSIHLSVPMFKSDVDMPPVMATKGNRNSYAIVIGLEKYRQKLPDAEFAVTDAQTVTEYLIKGLGYPEENVVTLTNEHAALGDFVKYIEKWLPNNVEQDSRVFVYYSGHGAPSPATRDAYLVPYDGDPTFIDETGYSLRRMYEALGNLKAKEIVVALDACFSGAGGRSVIAKGARSLVARMKVPELEYAKANISVLSASSDSQISSSYDEKRHGLFTYFLLKGIKNEQVITPEGAIKVDELYGYLKPQVERIARKQYNNEQTPQLQVTRR